MGKGATGQKEVVPHPSHPAKSPSCPTPSSSPPRASSSRGPTPCSTINRKRCQNEPRTQGTKKGRADIYPDGPLLLRRTPSPSAVQEREHISLHILWIRPFTKFGKQWREEEGERKAHQMSDDQRHPLRLLHGRDVLVGLQLADCKARQGHRKEVSLQGPQREDPASESE